MDEATTEDPKSLSDALEEINDAAFEEYAPPSDKSEDPPANPPEGAKSEDAPKKEPKEPAPPQAAVGDDPPEPGKDPLADPDPPKDMEPPAHWDLEAQQMFRQQAPEAQKFIAGRIKDLDKRHQERTEQLGPVRKVMERWEPVFGQAQTGVPMETLVERVFQKHYRIITAAADQRMPLILQMAREYGLELAPPATAPNPDAGLEPDPDPDEAYLQQKMQPLATRLQGLEQRIDQWQQHQEMQPVEAQIAKFQADMIAFEDEKTEAGESAHPYLDDVRPDMAQLAQISLERGQFPTPKELYDQAIWANSVTRAKVLAAREHQVKKETETEREEKVRKAKLAGKTLPGNGGPPPAKAPPNGIEDVVGAAFDAHRA